METDIAIQQWQDGCISTKEMIDISKSEYNKLFKRIFIKPSDLLKFHTVQYYADMARNACNRDWSSSEQTRTTRASHDAQERLGLSVVEARDLFWLAHCGLDDLRKKAALGDKEIRLFVRRNDMSVDGGYGD